MDEMQRYIIYYHSHLMTPKEAEAYRAIFAEEKARNVEGTRFAQVLRERWGSSDPEVLALIANGVDQFLESVSKRILRDHYNEIFFNRCPKCNALARTPKAKQCPQCFHSWHDNE